MEYDSTRKQKLERRRSVLTEEQLCMVEDIGVVQLQFDDNNKDLIMNHLAMKSLSVCLVYGVISILQTLNSRYLYRTLNFNYYSFVFAIQKVAIIILFFFTFKTNIKKQMIIKILPYSFFMCLNNIISSYCLTIMPLAAFLAFKKFIVLFILAITLAFNLPNTTTQTQNYCIIGIVVGGALVGEKDWLLGNTLGYLACLTFNLCQALSLQYSNYLYRHDGLEPSQLLFYNCLISLPYYIITMAAEAEFDDIYYFFQDNFSFSLLLVIIFSIFLACISEFSSSYIAMKISPFEKSIVANIKDLILMVISVVYLHDYTITPISGLGIILCLISSAIFSVPYLEEKGQTLPISQSTALQFHHHDGTSLLDDKKHFDNQKQTDSEKQIKTSDEIISQQLLNQNETEGIYLKSQNALIEQK